jgi:twitching motility protein PilT
MEEFGLPAILKDLIVKPNGLILVTGPTGSGKSTTLAGMISYLNKTSKRTVVTIEDPIEFLYPDENCIIVQQDLGDDTDSFANALTQALRHDVDVIVIGEMRDLPTISTALRAAETGHLVLGTLHTNDAVQSIDRIIDIFPPDQHRQIRLQLSQVIEAVISQVLLSCTQGGRIAAFEIMLANSVIRRLILEEKIHKIHPNMEMGSAVGMQTMEQALCNLVKSNMITREEALAKSANPTKLDSLIGGRNEGMSGF